MTRLFRRWLRPRRYVAHNLWSGLTLSAWQSSEVRTNYARGLLMNVRFREMVTVLQNEVPMPRLGNAELASLDAGVVQGYMKCLNNLLALAEPAPKFTDEVDVTYGVDERGQPTDTP